MAISLGPLDPLFVEAWWKRFEVPVFYEEDGSVSVGRGDAAAEAWRQFEQREMQVFRAWDLAGEDRSGVMVALPRRKRVDVLIPLQNPPRDTGESRSGRPDIRIYKTLAFLDPYLSCSCDIPASHPAAADTSPAGPHARDCAFVTGKKPETDPALAFLLDESFDDPPTRRIPPDGVPCRHPGCLSHISHPCEGCGRVGGRSAS